MILIKLNAHARDKLNRSYIRWLKDNEYPHSYENYLRDMYRIVRQPNADYIEFNSEKDYTWFLLNI